MTNFDAIIVAGGTGRRLGGVDKAMVEINGVTLLDLVLAAVAAADQVVIAGPPRPTAREVVWCREEPPGSGPAAGVLAALRHTGNPTVVVLAVDLPRIAPAVPVLMTALADAPSGTGAAVLTDVDGRPNYLAAAWTTDALSAALATIGDPVGAPMRVIYAAAKTVAVADPDLWGADCDTAADLEGFRQLS